MGVRVRWFDVGGGLGIDYDGSHTNSEFDSSVNYTIAEYVDDVVFHLHEACRDDRHRAPDDRERSPAARLTAHHAVLVTEVLGAQSSSTQVGVPDLLWPRAKDDHEVVGHRFAETAGTTI